MTKTQIIRFIENEDSSAITFKRFNQSPEDKYPTFSLCFKGAPLSWYHDDLIFSRFGLTSSRYAKTLEGKQTYKYNYNYTARLYKKIPIQTNDVVTEDVDKFYLNSSNIWKDVEYATEHEQGTTDNNQAISEKQIPFFQPEIFYVFIYDDQSIYWIYHLRPKKINAHSIQNTLQAIIGKIRENNITSSSHYI